MNNHHRLREQIDACRGVSDLARPEMAELAEALSHDKALAKELARCQRFDQAVAAGLSDVPVPEGLEARLLAAVEAAARVGASEGVLPETRQSKTRRWRAVFAARRMWYASAAAAAVLLVVGASGYYWHRTQQLIEQEQIASALEGWQKAAKSNGSLSGRLPSDFVLPPLPVKPVRYVPFKTDEGWSAVAVDCTTPVGSPATLFIVYSRAKFGVGDLPVTHLARSGKKVAAWRKGHVLYVLVEEVAKPRAGAAIHYGAAPPA